METLQRCRETPWIPLVGLGGDGGGVGRVLTIPPHHPTSPGGGGWGRTSPSTGSLWRARSPCCHDYNSFHLYTPVCVCVRAHPCVLWWLFQWRSRIKKHLNKTQIWEVGRNGLCFKLCEIKSWVFAGEQRCRGAGFSKTYRLNPSLFFSSSHRRTSCSSASLSFCLQEDEGPVSGLSFSSLRRVQESISGEPAVLEARSVFDLKLYRHSFAHIIQGCL